MSLLAKAREQLADEWRASNPATPEEIIQFYREATNLKDDLDAWHRTRSRQEWTIAIKAGMRLNGTRRILDVGAGAGHDLRVLAADNPEYELYGVEPNHALREGLRDVARVVEDISQLPDGDPFDAIICIDVLEHVPEPEALLVEMIKRLRMGGLLVEATATHTQNTPLHLPELRGWSPGRLLDRYGFTLREHIDRMRIWQRTHEKFEGIPSVLLCAYRSLTTETAMAWNELTQLGWRYQIHKGDALISRVRSVAVSTWMRETDGDVFLMVDDDIVFTPRDAEKVIALAREKRSVASAAYPVRGGNYLASRPYDKNITFGPGLEPIKIQYAGTGFFAAHRDVCEAIAASLPFCHRDMEWGMWPMFMPTVVRNGDINEYLSEDWAFCRRATDLGFDIWLDRTVKLKHLGTAEFTVDNMTIAVPATDYLANGAHGPEDEDDDDDEEDEE